MQEIFKGVVMGSLKAAILEHSG